MRKIAGALTRNLTLNYGLRWDRIEPWYEKYNQIATFVPGQQSVVFPGAPAGILYPTDPGVPRTLAPPGNRDFAPRIGLAYSPSASGDGLLAKILGGPGKTSIRASYGMFYTAIEALTIGVMSANAPYGTTYTSPAPPLFSTPFVTAATGQNLGQAFPGHARSAEFQREPSRPQHRLVAVRAHYRASQLSDHQSHSLHRGIHALARARIGSQYRAQRELCRHPGAPAAGARGSQPGQSRRSACSEQSREPRAGTNSLRPFWRRHTYTTSHGAGLSTAREGRLGSNFGSNANQATIGNSNYNALQVTLRHTSKRLNVLAGYTYSKSAGPVFESRRRGQSAQSRRSAKPFRPSM